MNKKRRMKNRETAKQLVKITYPPCPECGKKGLHWVGMPMTLENIMIGTIPEGFWTCDKFYDEDGRRLSDDEVYHDRPVEPGKAVVEKCVKSPHSKGLK